MSGLDMSSAEVFARMRAERRARMARAPLLNDIQQKLTAPRDAESEAQQFVPVQIRYGNLKAAKKSKRPLVLENKADNVQPAVSSSKRPRGLDADSNVQNEVSYAPPRKGPRSKNSVAYVLRQDVNTRIAGRSDWYDTVDMKAKFSRTDLISLTNIVSLIRKCAEYGSDQSAEKDQAMSQLREHLHKMVFFPFISGVLIKKSKILEDKGLPAVFDQENAEFPFDIRSDATAVYQRWVVGDIDPHLLRGITTAKAVLEGGKLRMAHRIDPEFKQRRSANAVGHNGLVNGQWWPLRICAMRDGAHGEQEAGIAGQTGKGAYSVVVASGGYKDEDEGEIVQYCGTESTTSTPTKNTNLLLEALQLQQQIRLIRGENKNSIYAPKKGLRYDGLYLIKGYEIVNSNSAMYRFTLRRCSGQDPIRFRGPETRPTDQELRQLATIKENLASMRL